MGNWGYNPAYRCYNTTYNWEGPTLSKIIVLLNWIASPDFFVLFVFPVFMAGQPTPT